MSRIVKLKIALATMPLPAVNMVATNVPGPQVPLYTLGRKMLDYYPYVPVGYSVGCGCAILTYDKKITFGLTADTQAMPDVERLRDFLSESYAELLAAAGLEQQTEPEEKKPPTVAEPKAPAIPKPRQARRPKTTAGKPEAGEGKRPPVKVNSKKSLITKKASKTSNVSKRIAPASRAKQGKQ